MEVMRRTGLVRRGNQEKSYKSQYLSQSQAAVATSANKINGLATIYDIKSFTKQPEGKVQMARHINKSADDAPMPAKLAIQRAINVMHAVVLRDIRSRYFNHGLGFLVVPLFPVAHVLLLLGIYTVTGRDAVFGDDLVLFFATGLLPVLGFTYISRFMSVSLLTNKNMLSFPAVHLLDIVIARAFLEFIALVLAFVIMYVFLIVVGSDPVPRSMADLLMAVLCAIGLAIGFGIIASVITAILPMFSMAYALSMVVVYLSSGAPIYLHAFPEQVVKICSYNPLFHVVEWIRSAYYLGYPQQDLDKKYLLGYTIASLFVGLALERLLRKQILAS